MKRVLLTVLSGLVALAGWSRAGEPLDNDALNAMLKAGFTLKVLEVKFGESDCQFDTSSARLIEVHNAAKEGGMSAADIDKLQLMVMQEAKKKEKELSMLAGQLMNGAINFDKQEYETHMRKVQRKGKSMIPYLMVYIDEEHELKRVAVLDAMKRLHADNAETVLAVRLMLEDRSKGVRRQAAETLAEIGTEKIVNEILEELDQRKGQFLDGKAFVPGFMEYRPAARSLTNLLTRSADPDGRLAAAFSLGRIHAKDRESVGALLDAVLDDHDEKLRDVAGLSLAWLRVPQAVPYIRKAYERYTKGRADVIRHLQYFRTPEAIEFLLTAGDNDDGTVRKSALETLRNMTGEAYETVEEFRSWWQYNKDRPEFVQTPGAGGGATVTEQPNGAARP
ncbi:MAG: HEAT repeat domain-containing protein [Planctomycetota bacterium]|nr:HEAT repeat domain-containing protein [Planctomycetota bacterium]